VAEDSDNGNYLQQPAALFILLITPEITKHANAIKIIRLSGTAVMSKAAARSNRIPAPHRTDLTIPIDLFSMPSSSLAVFSSFVYYINNILSYKLF
jgi:hypothetical protein